MLALVFRLKRKLQRAMVTRFCAGEPLIAGVPGEDLVRQKDGAVETLPTTAAKRISPETWPPSSAEHAVSASPPSSEVESKCLGAMPLRPLARLIRGLD